MALLKPDIGQPAEVNAARIGTGFDLIDDHSDQIQELYSGVSQNALLINNLAGTVGGISAALNGLPVRISATETAIATLTGRVNADEGTILTYGSNIAGLNSDVGGLKSNLAALTTTVQTNAQAAAASLSDAIEAVYARIAAEKQALQQAIACDLHRPGASAFAYTADVAAQTDSPTPIASVTTAFNQNGSLIRLFGATAMAPLSRIVMEPGRVYRDRIAFSRAVDTPDLSNNAVRIGVVWFDQSGSVIRRGLSQAP